MTVKIETWTAPDATIKVAINGQHVAPLQALNLDEARERVLNIARQHAASSTADVLLTATDPEGAWTIVVAPDGQVSEPPQTPPVLAPIEVPARAQVPEPLPTRRDVQRRSFLKEQQVQQPATRGWRGLLTHMGLRMAPSTAEKAERDDVHAVSQHWPGPRTIVVANGKGGAGKTPTTALLSAVFARYGGAGVVAWDANQTRGTLGWRTEQGPHEATVLDLLPRGEQLLGTGAQSADLAHYVHHQTADRYDVLRSQPIQLAADQRVTTDDVNLIWQIAAKFYRLIFIDTGNDESDPVWLQVVERADQIVVPTTTRADHAEAGALLLDALRRRDEHSQQLADNAVVIVTQADPRAPSADLKNISTGFADLARDVVIAPHDPAIVDGLLQWDTLRPETQRAWLLAGAAVARGL